MGASFHEFDSCLHIHCRRKMRPAKMKDAYKNILARYIMPVYN